MSYAQRRPIGASRTFAIVIVTSVHALLGYAIVTGLAYSVVHRPPDGLKTFNVEEVLPPPPVPPAQKPPPAPKQVPESPPRVVAPPPVVPTSSALPSATQTGVESRPQIVWPAAPPAPPASVHPAQSSSSPPPIETVPSRSATGDLQKLFRGADYPPASIARREQGSVTVQLTVGTMGRVHACSVTSSSGSQMLDNASCQILQSRAKFIPARDSQGNLTTDTVSQEIRWMLRS